MSHSINIPGFVTERKQDIVELSRFKRKANQNGGSTRERIAMYRTRSYLRYGMSQAVRQRNKRGPFLVNKGSKENKALYRRQKRFPRVLHRTFFKTAPTVTVASCKSSQPTKKKLRVNDTSVLSMDKEVVHIELDTQAALPGRLNTHIWHVKRFFVERQHNWYIPTKHKSRGLKAVDGLADKCVVQDVSYLMAHQLQKEGGFNTMQITGSAADINTLFNQFCDPVEVVVGEHGADTTPPTAASAEKEVIFFARGKFPAACIGPVTLLVVPVASTVADGTEPLDQTFKVVVCCHPVIAQAVYQQLFSALSSGHSQAKEADHASSDAMSVDSQDSADSAASQGSTPLSTNCKLQLLPAQWNRIRLRGTGAVKALAALLLPPTAPCSDSTGSAPTSTGSEEARNAAKIEYLRTVLSVRNVSNLWADGEVVAVSVRDPRLMSSLKTEADPTAVAAVPSNVVAGVVDGKDLQRKVSAQFARRPADLTVSPLFQDHTTFQFKAEHEVNAEKHAAKVSRWEELFQATTPFAPLSPPAVAATSSGAGVSVAANLRTQQGKAAPFVVPDHTCPLWITRKYSAARSHKTHKHSMEGFDITLPAAWGSVLFQTLQLRGGAAAVGSEEVDHLCAKAGIPSFPRDYPDTDAGREYWYAYHNTLRAENAKRPPAKQISHNSLATLLWAAASTTTVASPSVTEPASIDSEHFSSVLIVRGENYLKDFRPPPYEDLSKATIEETRLEIAAQLRADSTFTWSSPYIHTLPALPPLMFLQVLLVPLSKGLVLDLAEIICPTEADIELFCAHKLNTQARRKGSQDTAEDSPLSAAHSGFYKHSAAHHAAAAAQGIKKQAVQELPQNWLGVQLTKQVKIAPAVASDSEPSSAAIDQVTTSADHSDGAKEMKHHLTKRNKSKNKSKNKQAAQLCRDYDIGLQEGRRIIGTVTTGQKEHLNNTHFAVGLCNVNALNGLFRRSYGRYLHPQAHILVLFRNSRSDWLRPAVLQIV